MMLGKLRRTILVTATALLPGGAAAMMPPWVYDEEIERAAGSAVLADLSVAFRAGALECSVTGTVVRTTTGIGGFPRFDESRPLPAVPDAGAPLGRPAPGETITVRTPCIADGVDDVPVGGTIFQRYESLLEAAEVTILVDAAGAFHPVFGAGLRITKTAGE